MNELVKAIDHEAYVRGAWEDVETKWDPPGLPNCFGVRMGHEGTMVWAKLTGWGLPRADTEVIERKAWLAAYEWTVQRQEEIRQVDEEIAVCDLSMKDEEDWEKLLRSHGAIVLFHIVRTQCSRARTLSRLEAIRADLQRGMSAQPDVQEGRDE